MFTFWIISLFECNKYKKLYLEEKKKNELYEKHKDIINFLEGIAIKKKEINN
jgi:hypothetical protein